MSQYEMGVRDYWRILRKRKFVILLTCVAVAALTFFLTQYVFHQPPHFTASAEISVRPGEIVGQGTLMPVNVAQQAKLAKSEMLLKALLYVVEMRPYEVQAIEPAMITRDFRYAVMDALKPPVRFAQTADLACLFPPNDPVAREIRDAAEAEQASLAKLAEQGLTQRAAIIADRKQKHDFLYGDIAMQEAIIAQLQRRLTVSWDSLSSTLTMTVETVAAGFTQEDERAASVATVQLAETAATCYKVYAEWEGRRAIAQEIERSHSEIDSLSETLAKLENERREKQAEIEFAMASDEYQKARQEFQSITDRVNLLTRYQAQIGDYRTRRAEIDKSSDLRKTYPPMPAPTDIAEANVVALYNFSTQCEREKNEKLEFYRYDSHVIQALDEKISRTAEQMEQVVQGALENETRRLAVAKKLVDELPGSRLPELRATVETLSRQISATANNIIILNDRKSRLALYENQGVKVTIIGRPGSPEQIGAARAVAKTLAGAFVGLILGVIIAVLWETLDLTIGTIEEVETFLGTRVLGVVPHIEADRLASEIRERDPLGEAETSDAELLQRAMLVTLYDPKSIPAESFRHVRTGIDYASAQKVGCNVILVTSAALYEGKTTVAANLAVVMSQNGKRTCLVECDLRRPQLHHVFGIDRRPGLYDVFVGKMKWHEARRTLSDLLLGKIGVDTAVRSPGLENISIITCGTVPPNPVELLNSRETKQLFNELREAFDVVIVDCPPMLPVADAAVIAPYVDGAIIVYRAGAAPRTILSRAKAELESAGAQVYGVVLNDLRRTGGDLDSYSYKGYAKKAYALSEEESAPRVAGDETETALDAAAETTEEQIARKVDLLLIQKKADEAIETAHEAVRAMPDSISIRIELARAYAAAGRTSEAQAELIQVLNLDPRNLLALDRLAEMALTAGLEREALRWYEEILEFAPQDASVRAKANELRARTGTDAPSV